MAIDLVNERSQWITTHSFIDEDGAPVTPSAVFYRIDDAWSGLEIREDTEIEPISESIEVIWEESDTRILDELNAFELRRMTLSWTYGENDAPGHAQYLLRIRNLVGVPSPEEATT